MYILIDHIKKERLARRLSYKDIAKLLGYKNLNKGIIDYISLENSSKFNKSIINKLAGIFSNN